MKREILEYIYLGLLYHLILCIPCYFCVSAILKCISITQNVSIWKHFKVSSIIDISVFCITLNTCRKKIFFLFIFCLLLFERPLISVMSHLISCWRIEWKPNILILLCFVHADYQQLSRAHCQKLPKLGGFEPSEVWGKFVKIFK